MSIKQHSNVIKVDFSARKAVRAKDRAAPSKVASAPIGAEEHVGNLIMDALEGPEEWPEDLTPREKTDRLKQDLEYFIQSNEFNK